MPWTRSLAQSRTGHCTLVGPHPTGHCSADPATAEQADTEPTATTHSPDLGSLGPASVLQGLRASNSKPNASANQEASACQQRALHILCISLP